MKTIAKAVTVGFLLTAVNMNNVVADPTAKTLQNVKAAGQTMQPVIDKTQNVKTEKKLTPEETKEIQRQFMQQIQFMQDIQMRSMNTTKLSIWGKSFSLIPAILNAVLNPTLSKENFTSRAIAEIMAHCGLSYPENLIMQSVAMTVIALSASMTSLPVLRACCFQMWQNALALWIFSVFSKKGMQIMPFFVKTELQKIEKKCSEFIQLLVDKSSHKGQATTLAYKMIVQSTGAKKLQDIDKKEVKSLEFTIATCISMGEKMRALLMFDSVLGQSVIALLGAGVSHAVSSILKAS